MSKITLIPPVPLVTTAVADRCEICGREDLTAIGLKRHLPACQRKHGVTPVSDAVAPESPPVALASHPYRIQPSIPAAGAAAVAEIYGEVYGVQEQVWPDIRLCDLMEFGSFLHPENTSRLIESAEARRRAQHQLDHYRTRER